MRVRSTMLLTLESSLLFRHLIEPGNGSRSLFSGVPFDTSIISRILYELTPPAGRAPDSLDRGPRRETTDINTLHGHQRDRSMDRREYADMTCGASVLLSTQITALRLYNGQRYTIISAPTFGSCCTAVAFMSAFAASGGSSSVGLGAGSSNGG